MLGLGDEVGGDSVRISSLAGDDDLGGAGGHVDSALTRYEDFCGGDIEIAGADDLVDAGDGGGAEGERGDGLRSADAVELRDAGEPGRSQSLVCGLGRADNDARDSRHLRGCDCHQQR